MSSPSSTSRLAYRLIQSLSVASLSALSAVAFAQTSPFETGATALQTNLVTIATPIAIAAAVGRISWGWPIMALVGIGIIFAAPQIVTWARGLFGA